MDGADSQSQVWVWGSAELTEFHHQRLLGLQDQCRGPGPMTCGHGQKLLWEPLLSRRQPESSRALTASAGGCGLGARLQKPGEPELGPPF